MKMENVKANSHDNACFWVYDINRYWDPILVAGVVGMDVWELDEFT